MKGRCFVPRSYGKCRSESYNIDLGAQDIHMKGEHDIRYTLYNRKSALLRAFLLNLKAYISSRTSKDRLTLLLSVKYWFESSREEILTFKQQKRPQGILA